MEYFVLSLIKTGHLICLPIITSSVESVVKFVNLLITLSLN